MKKGCLYGVGLGPGDPELITLKAARILQQAPVIAYFSKGGKRGHAHSIAAPILTHPHEEIALIYPVTTELPVNDPLYESFISTFYEETCATLAEKLLSGHDVAVLCVGDPFFYGSFMHLYRRLSESFSCQVIPGISAMSGCWTNARVPITWGDDILTVIPGTLEASELTQRLRQTDAAVIMKLGSNFSKVCSAIEEAGMMGRAIYVEYGTMQAERIMLLNEKTGTPAPYFSLILIPGNGRKL